MFTFEGVTSGGDKNSRRERELEDRRGGRGCRVVRDVPLPIKKDQPRPTIFRLYKVVNQYFQDRQNTHKVL